MEKEDIYEWGEDLMKDYKKYVFTKEKKQSKEEKEEEE